MDKLKPFDSIDGIKLYVRPVGSPDLYEGFAIDDQGREVANTKTIKTKSATKDTIRKLVVLLSGK
jgi:hypothetical protein